MYQSKKELANKAKNAVVAVGSAAMVIGTSLAHAALDAGVSTDVAAAKTDVSTAGGLIIGVILAIAVIAWIRKVMH